MEQLMTARALCTQFCAALPRTLLSNPFVWIGLASALACAPIDNGGAVTGGAPGTGGVLSTGGVPSTGGVGSSAGGTVATGGALATGGAPVTGGAPATGGVSTGGVVATGGSSSGGAGGTGGAAVGNGGTAAGAGGTAKGGAGGTTNGGGGQAGESFGGKGGNGGSGAKAGSGGTGGTAGTGSGGTGGAGDFRPCPTNGDPCKILPLGDSITWGIQYDGAYRVELFNKAVAAGQKITFTGWLSNGPTTVAGMTFPKKNEGHSGWTIDQDAGLVPSPAFSTVPNIVLLMIGTNDVYAASGQATMPNRLGSLLDKIISAAPNALLVVAKITPLANAGSNNTIKTYNDAIPGLVQTRVAAGKHLIWVDMNTGFTSAMLSTDGVHPNKSGYDFMGGVWYTAISALLPK
jgi:hypothetical protein